MTNDKIALFEILNRVNAKTRIAVAPHCLCLARHFYVFFRKRLDVVLFIYELRFTTNKFADFGKIKLDFV